MKLKEKSGRDRKKATTENYYKEKEKKCRNKNERKVNRNGEMDLALILL
jgi:hypothetical protein